MRSPTVRPSAGRCRPHHRVGTSAPRALLEIRAEARGRLGDIAGARDDLRHALRIHPRGPATGAFARPPRVLSRPVPTTSCARRNWPNWRSSKRRRLARGHALEIASVLDMNLDRADRADSRAAEALALYQRLGDANGAARILDSRVMASFLDGRIDDGGTCSTGPQTYSRTPGTWSTSSPRARPRVTAWSSLIGPSTGCRRRRQHCNSPARSGIPKDRPTRCGTPRKRWPR